MLYRTLYYRDLGRHPYVEHYYRDFPSLFTGSWDIPACISKGRFTNAGTSQMLVKCLFVV